MPISRRQLLASASLAAATTVAAACSSRSSRNSRMPSTTSSAAGSSSIDRQKLVRQFNPVVHKVDPFSALSVGNGNFAFGADVTGLQTFPEIYEPFPICTTAHWAWHSFPVPPGLRPQDFRYTEYDAHGRTVGYATGRTGQEPLYNYLRESPHRLHLGRIGFDGIAPGDVSNIEQTLDLWEGTVTSRFTCAGSPVVVRTCCHPQQDLLAARIESPLLKSGKLKVVLAFPYGSPDRNMADWSSPEKHQSKVAQTSATGITIDRKLDDTTYQTSLAWSDGAALQQRGAHEFVVTAAGERLDLACVFASAAPAPAPAPATQPLPTFDATRDASRQHWERFWSTGAAVDLTGSTGTGAEELQRRIILSQFNTALHCAGNLPPAETGLLHNSWYGKFHLEMHWWHGVHFAAWDRMHLFDRSLDYYNRILPQARSIAKRQGYAGARWPKMTAPDGIDSPSPIGPLLIWQQPHPVYYAELAYQHSPTSQTLERFRDVVFESAEFMASYAHREPGGRYVLGPPLKTVPEHTEARTTMNPTFELAYWRFGLDVAQKWRERMKQPREPKWDEVLKNLAPLPTDQGRYLMEEGTLDTYTEWNWEHPSILGAYGVQPGHGVDVETMRRTLAKVMEVWQWDKCWGWDFPMTAMCAARLGEGDTAVKALLVESPKNLYHPNGHNYQRENLAAYLPGNGGFLAAIAMMCGAYPGAPKDHLPGFPRDGKWTVRAEGLRPLL